MSELQKSVEPRVIQVFFNGEAINIKTNANKWSEVVPLIENHEDGFSTSGKKAVLGSTKGVLQLPDALIPDGNQAIFLVQDEMKSGAALKATKPFAEMSFVDLRRYVKENNISNNLGSNPKRDDLVKLLNKYSGLGEVKGNSKASKETKEAIVKKVKKEIEVLRPDVNQKITEMEALLGTTIQDLESILSNLTGRKGGFIQINKKQVLGNTSKDNFGAGTNKIKTDSELAAEFRALNL